MNIADVFKGAFRVFPISTDAYLFSLLTAGRISNQKAMI